MGTISDRISNFRGRRLPRAICHGGPGAGLVAGLTQEAPLRRVPDLSCEAALRHALDQVSVLQDREGFSGRILVDVAAFRCVAH